jgi:ATP-dependent Clp protease protease subunit
MNPKWLVRARALAKEKLAAAPCSPTGRWAMTARVMADGVAATTEATLYIYDQIGRDWWTGEGVTAKDVVDAIAAAKKAGATSLAVRILSPGGDVFDGNGIHEALKRCGMKTTAYNDGLCASAATIVALGCDKVIAAPTSTWMMHRAWSIALGNAEDFRAAADLLEKLDGNIASVYAEKSGKDESECLALMSAGTDGTWMTAEECKAAGFADEIASVESGDATDEDDPTAQAIVRLMAQTEKRVAANRARLAAAADRLTKIPGASPGSSKPSGQPAGAKK